MNHEENVYGRARVTLDDALEGQAIEAARNYYSKTGGAREPVGERVQRLGFSLTAGAVGPETGYTHQRRIERGVERY